MVQDFYQRVVTRMGSEIEKEDNGELPRIRMGFIPRQFPVSRISPTPCVYTCSVA